VTVRPITLTVCPYIVQYTPNTWHLVPLKTDPFRGPQPQIVTAYPEVTTNTLTDGDEFLIIACDGIWDVLTNQQTVDFVRRRLAADTQLSEICEHLADECTAPDASGTGTCFLITTFRLPDYCSVWSTVGKYGPHSGGTPFQCLVHMALQD
jgi:hypothetical protein